MKKQQRYTPEFRAEAVKLVTEQGPPVLRNILTIKLIDGYSFNFDFLASSHNPNPIRSCAGILFTSMESGYASTQ